MAEEQKEVEILTQQIAEKQQQIDKLRQEEENNERKLAKLASEINALRRQLEECNEAIQRLEAELEEARRILEDKRKGLEQTEAEKLRLNDLIRRLQQTMDDLSRRIDRAEQRVSALENQIANLDAAIQAAEGRMIEMENKAAEARLELQRKTEEAKVNQEEQQRIVHAIAELNKQLQQLTHELSQCKDIPPRKTACSSSRGVSRAHERAMIQERINAARGQIQNHNNRLVSLRERHKQIIYETEKAKLALDHATKCIQHEKDSISNMNGKRNEAKAEMEAQKNDIATHEAEMREAKGQYAHATAALEAAQHTAEQLKGMIEGLKHEIDTKISQRDGIAQQLHDKEETLARAQDGVKELNNEKRTLRAEVDAMNKGLREKEHELQNTRMALNQKQTEASELLARRNDATQQLTVCEAQLGEAKSMADRSTKALQNVKKGISVMASAKAKLGKVASMVRVPKVSEAKKEEENEYEQAINFH